MKQHFLIDEAQRESFFMSLYKKVFPAVATYISKRGGTLEDARDIFQDSIVIYYEKTVADNFNCDNEKAYLMGICKHLWLKKFNGKAEEPLDEALFLNISDIEEQQPSAGKLLYYLETAGQKCMALLKAFYYDYIPLKDIAEHFGYSGERSATVQKYKCMEKVRETVKQQDLQYEDFID